jgi:hypothetical protein
MADSVSAGGFKLGESWYQLTVVALAARIPNVDERTAEVERVIDATRTTFTAERSFT